MSLKNIFFKKRDGSVLDLKEAAETSRPNGSRRSSGLPSLAHNTGRNRCEAFWRILNMGLVLDGIKELSVFLDVLIVMCSLGNCPL